MQMSYYAKTAFVTLCDTMSTHPWPVRANKTLSFAKGTQSDVLFTRETFKSTVRPHLYAPQLYADLRYTRFLGPALNLSSLPIFEPLNSARFYHDFMTYNHLKRHFKA